MRKLGIKRKTGPVVFKKHGLKRNTIGETERKIFLYYIFLIKKSLHSVIEAGKLSCDSIKYIKICFRFTETFAESYTITPFPLCLRRFIYF